MWHLTCSNEPWKVVWRQDTLLKWSFAWMLKPLLKLIFFFDQAFTFRVLQVSRVVLPLLWPARYYLSPTFGDLAGGNYILASLLNCVHWVKIAMPKSCVHFVVRGIVSHPLIMKIEAILQFLAWFSICQQRIPFQTWPWQSFTLSLSPSGIGWNPLNSWLNSDFGFLGGWWNKVCTGTSG